MSTSRRALFRTLLAVTALALPAAAPADPSLASRAAAKGTLLACTLQPATQDSHPVSVRNTTGHALKAETIINVALVWKSPDFPVGERDDCFALDNDLPANAEVTHELTTSGPGVVGQTCAAYISKQSPAVVHTSDGGRLL